MVTQDEELITSLPLTAEARERMLERLFNHDVPHLGELYVPGHNFYIHGSSHAKAQHMLKSLCIWLGIKPGYVGLQFESQTTPPALGQKHTIYLETAVLKHELLLGATIAHALSRYLLEQKKRVFLPDPQEQQSLIATATIVFGLGVVVANGLVNGTSRQRFHIELLGMIPPQEYGNMLRGFLRQRNIPDRLYHNHLSPYAVTLLGMRRAKKPIPIMREQYHKQLQRQFEKIGIAWLIVLTISIGIFTVIQRSDRSSAHIRELESRVNSLDQQKRDCERIAAYNKQYADTSDIQTVRSTNAEYLRCKGLDHQLRNAQAELYKLR